MLDAASFGHIVHWLLPLRNCRRASTSTTASCTPCEVNVLLSIKSGLRRALSRTCMELAKKFWSKVD
jgi:hypothetical protein